MRFPAPRHAPLLVIAALVALAAPALAQDTARVRLTVTVHDDGAPLSGAIVGVGDTAVVTGDDGTAAFRLPPRTHRLRVQRLGFGPVENRVRLRADTAVSVELEVAPGGDEEHEETEHAEELEGIVVSATRSEQRIEDVPVRVEVLGREEVEEKMLMTPGDISMMLNETGGLRVQTTSPSLGGAGVRVQGLRGRYTQILADGLPLYGGQSGALGLLQIPPMDLGQVEVIKGAASALYGASALGGVVNLVSRRPAGDRELLLNARAGRSQLLTVGATAERREGGGRVPGGAEFPEALETGRLDGGVVGRFLLGGERLLTVRASAMTQRHDHRFGAVRERDLHATAVGEAALGGAAGAHTWLLGAALQQERYAARDVDEFDYVFTVPALFAQDDFRPSERLALTASARLDAHSEYGAFLSPRLSALLRPAGGWSVRASAGTGFFAPTPFTEETETIGLARILPMSGVEAERAGTASLDVARAAGPLELNATLFASVVRNAVRLLGDGTHVALHLANVPGDTRTRGSELLARWHRGPLHLTASHAWICSTEPDPESGGRRRAPLVPRHAAGVVGMWESEGSGRVGVEVYYTGRQALEDNPYRAASRPYVVLGLLVERRVGRARLFLNAENLGDVRQTRWDPLLLPSRGGEGRWTTDAWAPLEGRTLNGGMRIEL